MAGADAVIALLASAVVIAVPLVPGGESQAEAERVVAIRDVRILPVATPPIERGVLLIRGDRIAGVGADITIPPDAEVVDGAGLTAAPGFFDTYTGIGLIEVAGVPASNDSQEPGGVTPQLRAADAYFLDSELIPLVRNAGTLVVLSVPGDRNVVAGQSALMRAAGTTVEAAAVKEVAAVHANLGEASKGAGFRTRMGAATALRQILQQARGHAAREDAPPNHRLDPVVRVLRGELPLVVRAHRRDDILIALRLSEEFGFRMILAGGADAPLVAAELAAREVPVLVQPDLQPSTMETAGVRYDNAAHLSRAGVRLAFQSNETTLSRQLVPNIGLTVAYGLPYEEALKALTLYPAQIFGVDDMLGSLEVGKEATFFLSRGDPLQVRTPVVSIYVKGRHYEPRSYQTRLCETFIAPVQESIPCQPTR
ncbi:MAG: amidohydrolase family protein [Acidobacteria bacterium]|nr:amidohydrolase family protein [Acidobacteriota bacterium]